MMTSVMVATALMVASGTAQAAIPTFSATCAEKVEVKAAEGGPIMIKGKEAKILVEKDNYYEAKRGKMTVVLTIGADGALSLAYTAKKKDKEEKGTCVLKA